MSAVDTQKPPNSENTSDGRRLSPPLTAVLIVGAFLLLTAAFWTLTTEEWLGRDLTRYFGPAAKVALSGDSPYSRNPDWIEPTATPPWIIPIALPFAYLPSRLARAAWLATSMLVYVYVLRKLKASIVGAVLFMLSPMILQSIMAGQLEWLVFLGLVVPRPIGLILLALKPQMGALLGVYWAIETLRDEGIWAAVRLVAPLGGVLLLSFALYGLWPLESASTTVAVYLSPLWPYGLPVAAAALFTSIRRREEAWAGAAGPLIAPYVRYHSLSMPLIWLVRDPWLMTVVWLMLWPMAVFIWRLP